MASQPLQQYTIDQYLDVQDSLGYHSEFHDGVVFPMEAATETHADLCASVIALLRRHFFPRCKVYDSSLNVYVESANRLLHPDATVVCGPRRYPKPNCIDNPTLVFEVLSASTQDYDYGTKRGLYFNFPSLDHYLLVSQTERLIGHYRRLGSKWIYQDYGRDDVIEAAEAEFSVSAVYDGILD